MSDEYVRKQVYECSKCKKLFDTKDAASEHYAKVHVVAEKYLGSYVLSKNDGSVIGKVIEVSSLRPDYLVIELFRMTHTIFSEFSTLSLTKFYISVGDFVDMYTAVTPDVAKKQLEQLFIDAGYKNLKKYNTILKDFPQLFEGAEYRIKGGDDGN